LGLALDEPKEGDESYEVDELKVIMDPFAYKIVKDSGGVNITNSMFGPTVELANSGGSCC
jgi:hypothetical protein